MSHVSDHSLLPQPILSQPAADEANASSMLRNIQNSADLSPPPSTIVIEAPSMTGVDLAEFHLFPKLAPEIRINIWRFTFPRNRVVTLNTIGDGGNFIHFSIPQPIPVALHVNIESRLEALRVYELSFQGTVQNDRNCAYSPQSSQKWSPRKFYVNFADDIFWIGMHNIDPDYDNRYYDSRYYDNLCMHDIYKWVVNRSDWYRIQRLLVSKESNFLGREWKFEHRLEHVKELMVESQDCRGLVTFPNVQWVEDGEDDEDDDRGMLALRKEIREGVKNEFAWAKERTPSWKAPILKFGRVERLRNDSHEL